MEQWEKEYLDAVTKSRHAKEQGKVVDCSYEEGYDSSRWVEITLPDGKKHYVPKETVGNRSRRRKQNDHYQNYYESCWNEVEKKTATRENTMSRYNKEKKQVTRYYSEKVSFFRTIFRMIKRLVILFGVTVLLIAMTQSKPDIQMTITGIYVLVSLGVIVHSIYYIIRCLLEGNLRL